MASQPSYRLSVAYGGTASSSTLIESDVKPAQAGPIEFERFEDLARKLVAVPKEDVDAKRNAS